MTKSIDFYFDIISPYSYLAHKKIKTFRESCGETTLAVASGITPENAKEYVQDVDLFMVATGINFDDDFYNIDTNKLKKLMSVIES